MIIVTQQIARAERPSIPFVVRFDGIPPPFVINFVFFRRNIQDAVRALWGGHKTTKSTPNILLLPCQAKNIYYLRNASASVSALRYMRNRDSSWE